MSLTPPACAVPPKLVWVQGVPEVRTSEPRAAEPLATQPNTTEPKTTEALPDWRQTLFHRIRNEFAKLGEGRGGTSQAEEAMGLTHHAYFYVARPDRAYDLNCVFYEVPTDYPEASTVAPVDTGGLVLGITKMSPQAKREKRLALLETHSLSVDKHEKALHEWLTNAFDDYSFYVDGSPPKQSLIAGVTVGPRVDPRAWTWEARVPAENFPKVILTPIKVYLQDGDLKDYASWVQADSGLPKEDVPDHWAWLRAHSVETRTPFATMLEDLTSGSFQ